MTKLGQNFRTCFWSLHFSMMPNGIVQINFLISWKVSAVMLRDHRTQLNLFTQIFLWGAKFFIFVMMEYLISQLSAKLGETNNFAEHQLSQNILKVVSKVVKNRFFQVFYKFFSYILLGDENISRQLSAKLKDLMWRTTLPNMLSTIQPKPWMSK